MKKVLLLLIIFNFQFSIFSSVCAQDIYQVAELSAVDLNGSARYVGMGGAMGALGGDISLMSSNPAAIGLYRRGDASVTGSLVSQPDSKKWIDEKPSYASFDQAGFVYSMPFDGNSLRYFNLGFNYHKHHDFNQLMNNANVDLKGIGTPSQTWQLADLCNYWGGADMATPLANLAYDAYAVGFDDDTYTAYNASSLTYAKDRWGSNSAFDFNAAFNFNDKYYFGLTASVYSVKQKSYMYYSENLLDVDGNDDGSLGMQNSSKLTGTGFDMKLGFLARPIDGSNFKMGITLTTPSYYKLHYRNELDYATQTESFGFKMPEGYYIRYDYNVRTPWRLGLSIGNTFFHRLALDAEYEFADYSCCAVSYDDEGWDDWNWEWRHSTKDRALNREIDRHLKSTHTLKVGAELMINPMIYVRGGYNFVTPAFEKDAYLDQFINSASVDVASNTDYLNLSGINRYTAGVGFKVGNFYADAAWLYQHQRGTLYAFDAALDANAVPYVNACPGKRISFNKSQVLLTLGLKF